MTNPQATDILYYTIEDDARPRMRSASAVFDRSEIDDVDQSFLRPDAAVEAVRKADEDLKKFLQAYETVSVTILDSLILPKGPVEVDREEVLARSATAENSTSGIRLTASHLGAFSLMTSLIYLLASLSEGLNSVRMIAVILAFGGLAFVMMDISRIESDD